jgi:hypothetical protein
MRNVLTLLMEKKHTEMDIDGNVAGYLVLYLDPR